ncbi:hypothetical protein HO133_000535 [Letharia lupina]|uniref:Uncharacterized protein n=1 Tax=Letharia lupina TaxID=560253 RepID=A0A8H6CHR0_9LECA|nr:uncharacterized protein HO133_000535 [Letharia lupina]KAF6223692.1 hypothetical protein HO133_000535 [Letharia lupina]
MAELHTKQLEEKLARYKRIMNECPRCKAALASEEKEDATPSAVPPASAGSSRQIGPKASSTASALSPKEPVPTTRQGRSNQSSKQATSTFRPIPSPSSIDDVSPIPSIPGSSSRSREIASGPPLNTRRPPTRLSNQTNVGAVSSPLASASTQQPLTAHSLNFRPTSLKPSTSEVDTLEKDANGQNSNRPNLSRLGSNTGRPRNDPHKQAVWIGSADKMLGEVPLGWVWNGNLSQLDNSMLAAVVIHASAVQGDMTSATDETGNKDHLLRLVRGFAHRHSGKRVNFQHFLLVCLCNVLSVRNIPQDSIVEALQICISDTSERNIGRYLKGAQWVNRIMDRLFFTGWRYRAIDLVVIWDRSVAMYGTFASSASTSDYFLSHLTRSEYCEDVQEIPNRVHDTMPWIVKKEFGDEVSDNYILETKHLHSSAPPSPHSNSRSLDDAGSTSRSLSFHTARQSTTSPSTLQKPGPPDKTPSDKVLSDAYLQESALRHGRLFPSSYPDEAAGKHPPTSQSVASPRTKQMIPDRSAKPLGDPDGARRRRNPSDYPSVTDLPVSTSLRESAPRTQSTKRPLPGSPPTASQPTNTTRRRQHPMERSSREEMGRPSQSEKKGSKDRRGRA